MINNALALSIYKWLDHYEYVSYQYFYIYIAEEDSKEIWNIQIKKTSFLQNIKLFHNNLP